MAFRKAENRKYFKEQGGAALAMDHKNNE